MWILWVLVLFHMQKNNYKLSFFVAKHSLPLSLNWKTMAFTSPVPQDFNSSSILFWNAGLLTKYKLQLDSLDVMPISVSLLSSQKSNYMGTLKEERDQPENSLCWFSVMSNQKLVFYKANPSAEHFNNSHMHSIALSM